MEYTKDAIEEYREDILELGYSFFKPKVLLTAVRLNIFDIIGDIGLSADDVAANLNSDKNAAEVFLDAMVSIGLLEKESDQYFNTEEGKEVFISGKERCQM